MTKEQEQFLREPQVLELFPFCKTTLWAKVREGTFPKPRKLGPRITCWVASELAAYAEKIKAEGTSNA